MILKMEKLSVFGLLEDREAVLSELMSGQCIQMRPVDAMEGYGEVQPLTQSVPVESYALEQQLSRYSGALAALNFYAKKPGMFYVKPRVLYEKLEDGAMLRKADEICGKVEGITAEINARRAQKSKNLFTQAALRPWAENDLPLELSATKTTEINYYMLPVKTDFSALLNQQRELAPACALEMVSQDKEQQYLLAICHKNEVDTLWGMLKGIGATKAGLGGLSGTAMENIAALQAEIDEADRDLAALDARLREAGQDIFPLQYAFDALSVRVQREKAGFNLLSTQKTFCFTAWVPQPMRKQAEGILDKYGCYYEMSKPDEGEQPPILLKNSNLVAPYEAVTFMYSPPSYWGIDPNPFVAVCYFIIFGMMLGDAGFGLVLFLGGLFMLKKMDLGRGAKNLIKVITMGGLSSVIWGIVFGSYFGDVVQVVAREFFGKTIVITPLLDPITQAMTVMILCLGIGIVHIFLGMGVKAYMLVKTGHPWIALFDVGFWYAFIIGLLMMLLAAVLGLPIMGIAQAVAIAGATGLVLTQGRDSKNPVMKLVNGIGSLYGISGYLSDVLSYSRILALGLATGIIAQVFNIIGTLVVGDSMISKVFGAVMFIVVFAIGSALNLGINTLGSYVHTARLHYIEFFGKFYEDGGKAFLPLAAQTKYIVVTNKEEL